MELWGRAWPVGAAACTHGDGRGGLGRAVVRRGALSGRVKAECRWARDRVDGLGRGGKGLPWWWLVGVTRPGAMHGVLRGAACGRLMQSYGD